MEMEVEQQANSGPAPTDRNCYLFIFPHLFIFPPLMYSTGQFCVMPNQQFESRAREISNPGFTIRTTLDIDL